MPKRTDIAYLYDGSYEGFLCCVFESFENHEIPSDILAETDAQLSLFPRAPSHGRPVPAAWRPPFPAASRAKRKNSCTRFSYLSHCRESACWPFCAWDTKPGPR